MSLTDSSKDISKRQVLEMIVGLIESSDYFLIEKGAVFKSGLFSKREEELIKDLAFSINELFSSFCYEKSAEFLRMIEGKSDQYKKVKIKNIKSPASKESHRKTFGQEVCRIDSSERIDDLVAEESRGVLERARFLFSQLSE